MENRRYCQDRTHPRRSWRRSTRCFYWRRRPPTKCQIRSSIPSPLLCSRQKRSRIKSPSRCSRWAVQRNICSRRSGDGSSRCYFRWSAVPEESWSGVGRWLKNLELKYMLRIKLSGDSVGEVKKESEARKVGFRLRGGPVIP